MGRVMQPSSGQAVVEYGILMAVLVAALLAMQAYSKRSLQAGVKMIADTVSIEGLSSDESQIAGMEYEAGERSSSATSSSTTVGDTLSKRSRIRTVTTQQLNPRQSLGGAQDTTVNTDSAQHIGELGGGVVAESDIIADIR